MPLARPRLDAATLEVEAQYNAIHGIVPGTAGSFTALIAPHIPKLIDALINCFSSRLSSQEVAEQMRSPSVWQIAAAKRACMNKAREQITRKDNPTGQKISGKECRRLRKEMRDDLFTAMMSTVQSAHESDVVELVEETRANRIGSPTTLVP